MGFNSGFKGLSSWQRKICISSGNRQQFLSEESVLHNYNQYRLPSYKIVQHITYPPTERQ